MSGVPDARLPSFIDEDDRKSVVLDDFRLDFTWTGDRWTHAIDLREGERWTRLAASLEAGEVPEPARVMSPSYQQFHWHEDDLGGRAMLIGQSGPHHFSAVFALRGIKGREVVLVVEVADRCLSPIEALACTFLVDLPSGNLKEADPSAILWTLDGPAGKLKLESVDRSQLALAEAGRTRDSGSGERPCRSRPFDSTICLSVAVDTRRLLRPHDPGSHLGNFDGEFNGYSQER